MMYNCCNNVIKKCFSYGKKMIVTLQNLKYCNPVKVVLVIIKLGLQPHANIEIKPASLLQ